jgi:hypothetical protein
MPLIADIIAQDPVGMEQLRAARTLDLPDWCIAAGIRNICVEPLSGAARPFARADIGAASGR